MWLANACPNLPTANFTYPQDVIIYKPSISINKSMVFVRTKKIKGRDYYYLVKSIRKGNTIKQITLEYLGSEMPSKNEIKKIKKRYE